MIGRDSETTQSRQQWRPCGVRCKARRRHLQFVAAGDVDCEERWPGVAPGIAEEHQHPAIGRESRALIMITLGKNTFTLSVDAHDGNCEVALALLGECDEIATRRPNRGRIAPVPKADALRGPAARGHDVDLRPSTAVRLKTDTAAVRRVAWRGIDGGRIGEARRRP